MNILLWKHYIGVNILEKKYWFKGYFNVECNSRFDNVVSLKKVFVKLDFKDEKDHYMTLNCLSSQLIL